MILHYFKATLRAAKKQKLVSALNIAGLSISIAACLAIALYVIQELSYDTSHRDAERIYRLVEIIDGDGHIERSSSNPFPVLPALVADHGDLMDGWTRFFDFQISVKSLKLEDGRLFSERNFYYTDSTVFELLDIPLLRGDSNALSDPFSIVLSENLAQKYFGDEDPIGKVVFLAGQDQLKCTVTGILGQGGISHIQPEALISIETCRTIAPFVYNNWVWNPCWTYIRLKKGVSPKHFEDLLPAFVEKNYPEFNKHMVVHHLQPITDIHLHSNLEFEMGQNSSMNYIYIFISSGIILLLIACINFVNLTSASLLSRAKEAGMRKVAGATQTQLITQVLFECFLYTLLSFAMGLCMLWLLQPWLKNAFGVQLPLRHIFEPKYLLTLIATLIVVAFLSGIYPAISFAQMHVTNLFKGGNAHLKKGKWIRRVLVIGQFSVAVLLIVFTIVAQKQLHFMQQREKGFNAENILIFNIQTTPLQAQQAAFKRVLKSNSGVINATVMNDKLGISNNNHEYKHEGMDEGEWKYFPSLLVDEDFTETFEIPIVAGRSFDNSLPREDSTSVIINRAMAKWLGYESPQGAIGKPLRTISGNEKIIGVTDDFHYKSLHHPVGPFVLDIADRPSNQYVFFSANVAVKVVAQSDEILAHLEETWKQFVSNKPFEYSLLSEEIEAQYESESQMSALLKIFSALAMIVACMGLFALSWFVARSKTKEIAIRKVHGADLLSLLSVAMREQLILVMASFLLSFPIAFILLTGWLESFAFRVNPGILPYLFAGTISLTIAVLTMAYHAMLTAHKNPATVLKFE